MSPLVPVAVAMLLQASSEDRVSFSDRTERRGRAVTAEGGSRLRITPSDGPGPIEVALEEAVRIVFAPEEPVRPEPGEQVRLTTGGALTGKGVEYRDGSVTIGTSAGRIRVPRSELRTVVLAPATVPAPALKEAPGDAIVREVEERPEGKEPRRVAVVDYGRLEDIGSEFVTYEAAGERRRVARSTVVAIHLLAGRTSGEASTGRFARVTFRNGDRLVGVLKGIDEAGVDLFSHAAGRVTIPRAAVHSLAFVPNARVGMGHVLVCDQGGVHEFDRQGREVWVYETTGGAPFSARRLPDGHVLVATPTLSEVIELRPQGRSSAEVVWRLPGLVFPVDAWRVDSGSVLVAEQQGQRVAEYDPRTNAVVWQSRAMQPLTAQPLDGGRTLVTTFSQVTEIDREGREVWRAALKNLRPWRAIRLDNGNTLVTDQQSGQVVEIDPQSRELWRLTGLSRPTHAVRLEDGNVLILEMGLNRIVEVDPLHPKVLINRVTGLNSPQGMSIY